jgi:hypothetical protein
MSMVKANKAINAVPSHENERFDFMSRSPGFD